ADHRPDAAGGSAEGHRAETDFGNEEAGAAELTIAHRRFEPLDRPARTRARTGPRRRDRIATADLPCEFFYSHGAIETQSQHASMATGGARVRHQATARRLGRAGQLEIRRRNGRGAATPSR